VSIQEKTQLDQKVAFRANRLASAGKLYVANVSSQCNGLDHKLSNLKTRSPRERLRVATL